MNWSRDRSYPFSQTFEKITRFSYYFAFGQGLNFLNSQERMIFPEVETKRNIKLDSLHITYK